MYANVYCTVFKMLICIITVGRWAVARDGQAIVGLPGRAEVCWIVKQYIVLLVTVSNQVLRCFHIFIWYLSDAFASYEPSKSLSSLLLVFINIILISLYDTTRNDEK